MINPLAECNKIMFQHKCGNCGERHGEEHCPMCGNRWAKCQVCGEPVVWRINHRLCLTHDQISAGR